MGFKHQPPFRRKTDPSQNLQALTPGRETQFYPLDPDIRYIWIAGRGLFWIFALGGGLIATFIAAKASTSFSQWAVPAYTVLLGFACIHLIWPLFSYRYWGFAVRDYDFLIRSGVLFKEIRAVPFARIQHVDNNAGPLEQTFGISTLVIHTAGSHLGSLAVPGLPTEQAESLRDYLSKVGHTHANL